MKLFDDDIGSNDEEADNEMADTHSNDLNDIDSDPADHFNDNNQNNSSIPDIRDLLQQHELAENEAINEDLANILDDRDTFRDAIESIAMNFARTTININSILCTHTPIGC